MVGFMLEVRSSGGKTYYQRYTDERGRERQFKVGPSDVLTLSQARKKGRQIKAEAIVGSDPQAKREALRLIPTLRKFVADRYLPFIRTYKRSWKTDETVLRIHILPEIGGLCLDEITSHSITSIIIELRKIGYSSGTVGRVIIILRYIFNLARKWKVLQSGQNPAADIPVPADVQRNRFLDKAEIARLIDVLATDENQVASKAILLLLMTGARRNEITHAKWEYVDLHAGTILVPVSKSGKPRYVVLNKAARALLGALPGPSISPFLFPSPVTGHPPASLHFPWSRIRKRAGLTDVRLHDLRHSFASQLVNGGRSLYDVQRLLGHANTKATQRYAHLSHETLASAAEVMGTLIDDMTGKGNKKYEA